MDKEGWTKKLVRRTGEKNYTQQKGNRRRRKTKRRKMSHILSLSFSMYSNFGVSAPFEVMMAFKKKT